MERVVDFLEQFTKVLARLEQQGICTLATSANNKTTARSISVVVYNGKIALQTSEKMEKFQQITQNENVALCYDNIQITGMAKIKEHPFQEKEFIEKFKKKHFNSFKTYSGMKSERVIEITPLEIKCWLYFEKEPYVMTLDVSKQIANIEKYNRSETG